MRLSRKVFWIAGMWLSAVISGRASATLVEGTDVLEGVAYTTYVEPADSSYRFACLSPCAIPLATLQAASDGFRDAKVVLLQLTGIDTLPRFKPIDIYFEVTPGCPLIAGLTGYARSYFPYGNGAGQPERGKLCLFEWEYQQSGSIQYFTPLAAGLRENQELIIHEYTHTMFFDRAFAAYEEEIVKFLGVRVALGELPGGMCSELLPPYIRLPRELCKVGVDEIDLKGALIDIDTLYAAGLGFHAQATSTAQFRSALDHVSGLETSQAFLNAGYSVQLVGGLFEGVETSPGSGVFRFHDSIGSAFAIEGLSSMDAAVKLEYPTRYCSTQDEPFFDPNLSMYLLQPNHREGTNELPMPEFGPEGLRITYGLQHWLPPAGVEPDRIRVHVCLPDQLQLGWRSVQDSDTVLDPEAGTITFTVRSGGLFAVYQDETIYSDDFENE
jgi:hypothetical protein